ncbi:MAG: phosphatidate cytidylyltransferase [Clostridia bacterium]|nr:phosphatidate cytidylyltransferase [Clostridia bacterium]
MKSNTQTTTQASKGTAGGQPEANVQTIKQGKKGGRTLVSVLYVALWTALFTLKWCVPDGWGSLGFDVFFCAIAVLGSIEFLKAMGGVSYIQKAVTIAFCGIVVVLFVLTKMLMDQGYLAMICTLCVYEVILALVSVFDHRNSPVKGMATCSLCMLYCGLLPTCLAAINHLASNSMAGMLALFLITVLTDTFAFLIGSALKRFVPLKLAPQLSPNKTVIGAAGGLIGGIVGGLLAFVVIYYLGGLNGTVMGTTYAYNEVYLTFTSEAISPILVFALIGLVGAVLAIIGDLFESAIKRECDIKDMGHLLGAHGGVLDRVDSLLACGLVCLICFGTIIG